MAVTGKCYSGQHHLSLAGICVCFLSSTSTLKSLIKIMYLNKRSYDFLQKANINFNISGYSNQGASCVVAVETTALLFGQSEI